MQIKIITSNMGEFTYDNVVSASDSAREFSSEGNDVHKTSLKVTINDATLSSNEVSKKLKDAEIEKIEIYDDENNLVHSFEEYNRFRQANRFIDTFNNKMEISFTIVEVD